MNLNFMLKMQNKSKVMLKQESEMF